MNFKNCTLLFLGGVVTGVAGVYLYEKHKKCLKPIAAEIIAQGIKLKDKTAKYIEIAKENAEDIVEEAKHRATEQ